MEPARRREAACASAAGPGARRGAPPARGARPRREAPRPRPPRAPLAADAAGRRRVEAALEPRRVEAGRIDVDGVRGEVVGEPRRRSGAAPRRGRTRARAPRRARASASSPRPGGPRSGSRAAPRRRPRRARRRRPAARTTSTPLSSRAAPRPRPQATACGGARRRTRPPSTRARPVKVLSSDPGVASTRSPGACAQSPLSRSCTPRRATRGSPRSGAATPCSRTTRGAAPPRRGLGIDLVVVGPEAPLVAGVADVLRHAGVAVFGPGAAPRGSRARRRSRRSVMAEAGVPDGGDARRSRAAPCVVKADGLAAGKGVCVCRTAEELDAGLRAAAALGRPARDRGAARGRGGLGVRARRDGEEAVAARRRAGLQADRRRRRGPEHRRDGRVLAGRRGVRRRASSSTRCTGPSSTELAQRGTPFVGVPLRRADADRGRAARARVQLPLRGSGDAGRSCPCSKATCSPPSRRPPGRARRGAALALRERAAVTVVLAAGDYPERGDSGSADLRDRRTPRPPARSSSMPGRPSAAGALVTNGGRILGVTAVGADLGDARDRAYAAAELILPRHAVQARHRAWGRRCLSAARRDPRRLGVRPRADAGGDGRARRARDRVRVRGAVGAPEPEAVAEYAGARAGRGLKVLICGAGLAAALPGVAAAHTELPVIGVPLRSSKSVLDGLDALLSIVQMPRACRSPRSGSTTRRTRPCSRRGSWRSRPDPPPRESRTGPQTHHPDAILIRNL